MKIHISIGDPGGIGPEIVFKTVKNLDCKYPIVIHIPNSLKDYFFDFFNINYPEYSLSQDNKISVKLFNSDVDSFEIGKVSKLNGEIAANSIISAVQSIKKGDVLITAPINKEAINLAGYNYQGHTEMLATITNTKEVFMSFWGKINTLLITTHISMQEVIKKVTLTDFVYNKIISSYPFVKNIFKREPKIALCALNPHAGEGGLMGDEDSILEDSVKKLRTKGINISGPFPSDTIFYRYLKGEFDFIYSIYHDQALIPIKTLFFDQSVNFTLGLPFIRISPDHGTAFDIAYKDRADISSFKYCFTFINNLDSIDNLR